MMHGILERASQTVLAVSSTVSGIAHNFFNKVTFKMNRFGGAEHFIHKSTSGKGIAKRKSHP